MLNDKRTFLRAITVFILLNIAFLLATQNISLHVVLGGRAAKAAAIVIAPTIRP